MAQEPVIIWAHASPKRRITAYLIDWGMAGILTVVLAGPATIEWGMPRPTLIPAIALFYILWRSVWTIFKGRTFGHRTTGIWLLTNQTEPAMPSTKQRFKLAVLWTAASVPPIMLVTLPAIAYTWLRAPDGRHIIDRITNTTAASPESTTPVETEHDASLYHVLTADDGE